MQLHVYPLHEAWKIENYMWMRLLVISLSCRVWWRCWPLVVSLFVYLWCLQVDVVKLNAWCYWLLICCGVVMSTCFPPWPGVSCASVGLPGDTTAPQAASPPLLSALVVVEGFLNACVCNRDDTFRLLRPVDRCAGAVCLKCYLHLCWRALVERTCWSCLGFSTKWDRLPDPARHDES